jgi:hypothetical protein
MAYGRIVLAGFVGGLAAAVVALAWKASQETGKSLQASFVDIPTEAQRLAAEARDRALEARERAVEAANARWQAVKEKEAELAKRLPGKGGDATSMIEEAVIGDEAQPV